MSRDKLANELLSEFAKYFSHELLPKLGEYDTAVAFELYNNNPMIRAKADSFTISVLSIVDKHVQFTAPTPMRECSNSERADGDHFWVSQNHQDLDSGDNLTVVHCKYCGQHQQ
jgi:hypothetical protein